MVCDGLFDWPYALLGAAHRHWVKAKESAATAYDKLAYCANKLGFKSPVYLILLVSLMHVLGNLTRAAVTSFAIVKEEREAQKKAADVKA